MAVRVDSLPFPSTRVRRLLAPALPWALIAAVFVMLKRQLLQPRLPRMSDEWLQNLDRRSGHSLE